MCGMRTLQIKGHEIVALPFNEEKTGTPAIFIHGLTASVHFWGASNPPVVQERTRWYSLSLPGHYPARFPSEFRAEDLTAEMMASVLGGEADPVVPPARFRLIAEKVPYSRLVLWEGCGHLPQGERSSLYQQAIASWIEEHT